jgi:hypothetical protein
MIKRQFTKQLDYCNKKQNNKQFLRNVIGVFAFALSFIASSYAQNIGINTTGATPNSKALLDVNPDNVAGEKKGVLFPRMTTTERNTLSGTGTIPESLLIYNTTTKCFEAWNQSALGWVAFGCLNCQLPGLFGATSVSDRESTSFTANWSASGGATGYYLDVSTSSTFASFVTGFNNLSVSNVVTYSVTGLTNGITYYYRVRAVNACGTSTNSNTIEVTVPAPLSAGCSISQVEADYGTVVSSLSGASQTWITRNLGATAIATSATSTTNEQAGCYFQFNRSKAYGYDNGGAVSPAWTITSISESSNWLIANDPCRLQLGGTWRLPTYTEWLNTDANGATGGWDNLTETFADVLKIHGAGYLATANGLLNDRGTNGYYWSSTQENLIDGRFLTTDSGISLMDYNRKAYGFSVRCLK